MAVRGVRAVGVRQRARPTLLAATLLASLACGEKIGLPEEPDTGGIPTGEVAYVVQYRWEGVPALGDLVLTRGQILYAVEDSSRVRAWFSDTATPRENPSRSLPVPAVLGSDTLEQPVQLAEGPGNTLWVAYLQPRLQLVQFDVGVTPPVLTGQRIVDAGIQELGGITVDPDSGFVYVADAAANTITKYAPDAGGGRAVALLASEGNGDHFVRGPRGLAWFDDQLLVADAGKAWLQVLDADVPFTGQGQVAGTEEAPLQLGNPVDVWVDRNGLYYVADIGTGEVLQLRTTGEIKEVVTELDADAARRPPSVVANATQVWVPDPERGRLTVYQINTESEVLP